MTGVTYDMQKLDEAVSALAGPGTLQARLQDALIPLGVLHMGGMHNTKRAPQFDEIYRQLTTRQISDLSDDEAWGIARQIVELHSGNWHDAVWALEDGIIPRV